MENLRNRRTVDLVVSEEKLKKLAAQPSFKQFNISKPPSNNSRSGGCGTS